MIAVLLALVLLGGNGAVAAPHSLIICGSGGQAEYSRRFATWGQRLHALLSGPLQHPAANIHLLSENQSLEAIEASMAQLGRQLQDGDRLFVYLIGHGSFRDGIAKLNIPGPDLSAPALDQMLQRLPTKQVVLVNSASTSAAFINALSAPERILCTSTRSVEERGATRFMEFFLQGLEDGSADLDRNGRTSLLEACHQGATLTQAYYEEAGLLATEHALLDDDGDGKGVRPQLAMAGRAAEVYLQADPPLDQVPAQLRQAYRQAIAQAEALIEQKGDLPQDQYYQRLEALLIEAALLNRQIQTTTAETK